MKKYFEIIWENGSNEKELFTDEQELKSWIEAMQQLSNRGKLSYYHELNAPVKAFNFEVYTCNPATGEEGWDIKFPTIFARSVKEARKLLKSDYPNFDCVILWNYGIEIKDGSVEAKNYATGAKYFHPTYEEQYK